MTGATEVAKGCRGECRKLLPRSAFGSNGRGFLYNVCKKCRSEKELTRYRKQLASGLRRCDTCRKEYPLHPDYYEHVGRGLARTCTRCLEKLRATPDPIAEATADLEKGLRARVRWAVTLAATLSRHGLDLAGYKALRGAAHAAFEREWSEAMKAEIRAENDARYTRDEMHEEALKEKPRPLTPFTHIARDSKPSEPDAIPFPIERRGLAA